MRVIAFTKYGREAASTRQRVLQYIPALEEASISVQPRALLGDDYVRGLVSGKSQSPLNIARAYASRMAQLRKIRSSDVLWIYAELFPYLPAVFERLGLGSGAPIVYDFDDAFFHQYDDNSQAYVRRLLTGKLEPLIRGAAMCCCGNAYLQEYARRFTDKTMILPTVVDTKVYRPRPRTADGVVKIGWIGTPSTWPYLRPILPMLADLVKTHNVRVLAIGGGRAAVSDSFAGLELLEWSEHREAEEVAALDIGIMPLPDQNWARGKSGYKLIQYMAAGLPVVASPVGVNREIVDAETGFLVSGGDAWREALVRLITVPALRERMGIAGRRRAETYYSLVSQSGRLVDVFRSIRR